MSEVSDLLKLALSDERSTAERIGSLGELREFLRDEAVVADLAAGARVEKSLEVRRAMQGALLDVDITRLKDRAPYLDCLAYFAAMEPESELRLAAITRLGALAPDDAQAQAVIAETLDCDLDERVQAAGLDALQRCVRKSHRTAEVLIAFSKRAPRAMRMRLIDLYTQLDSERSQAGIAALLSPWESVEIRARLIDELEKFPSLTRETAAALSGYLALETQGDLRERAVRVVLARKDADVELLRAVLRWLEDSPDQSNLVDAFRDRLASTPGLVEQLARLFGKTGSSRLKLRLLALLAEADVGPIYIAAIRDASPWVRWAAIDWCRRHLAKHTKEIQEALAAAIPGETIASLRHAMVNAFLVSRRKEQHVERFLVDWIGRESDPRIEESLAAVLPGIAMTDENRAAILRAYRKVLLEPFFSDDVKAIVRERLRSFAYRNEPELVECLRALLERESSIGVVEELHRQLRKLEPDLAELAPLLLKLFYRFIHHYPREPLDQWTADFRKLAAQVEAVRDQIPYIVRLSGATWILDSASDTTRKTNLLPAVLDAIRQGGVHRPERLLEEAWESRTLRKSDLVALFNRLIDLPDLPGLDGLLQTVFGIMKKANLVTPEILDRCFSALDGHGGANTAYEARKFLEDVGRTEPSYRDRVVALFNQANYSAYCRSASAPSDARFAPRTWNDWEYQGWRLMYNWPIAELFVDLQPLDQLIALLSTPPDPAVPAVQSIHYLTLEQLWNRPSRDWGKYQARDKTVIERELSAIGTLMRNAAAKPMEPLRDRAVVIFWKEWKNYADKLQGRAPAPELAEMAADVYLELMQHHQEFAEGTEAKLPEPLKAMDLAHLQKRWTHGPERWDELVEITSAEREQVAQELYRHAAWAMKEGRKEEAASLLDELLARHAETNCVRERRQQIDEFRAKL